MHAAAVRRGQGQVRHPHRAVMECLLPKIAESARFIADSSEEKCRTMGKKEHRLEEAKWTTRS